jgi:hypothetical protein
LIKDNQDNHKQIKNNHKYLVIQHDLRTGNQPVQQDQIRKKLGVEKVQRGKKRLK